MPLGSYTSEQSVTSPTGLIPAMNAFNGTGARLILSAGQVYTANFTLLSGTTSFLTIEGSALGDGSATEGAVVEITAVNTEMANTTPLQY
jgi:hypothetical protein